MSAPPGAASPPRALLLACAGLRIGGGIASVARSIARACDDATAAGRIERSDRVLLLEDPANAFPPPARGRQLLARGSQLRMAWQLWRTFRRHHHDLVLFDQAGLARCAGLPLPGFPPPRYAVFAHGIELELAAASRSRRRALAGAWRVLANSEHTGEVLRSRLPELAERVRVTPLCIDPERLASWQDLPEPAAEAPRDPAVLIVGRMWASERGKGHDTLLEAWPEVRSRAPGAELWVVGEGDDRARLEGLVEQSLAGQGVRFFGAVSDAELAARYRRAAVFAMPSRQEGFGLVYAEAMWHGTPCVGSTADAARELIEPAVTGLLVPYGDPGTLAGALVHLLGDPARARRMGAVARERALRRFSYERFREDLLRALGVPDP